jgi:hypothetical protein
MTVKILGRRYTLRRIPLRLVLNGEKCRALVNYDQREILIGDPDAPEHDVDRDALILRTAETVALAARQMAVARRRARRS